MMEEIISTILHKMINHMSMEQEKQLQNVLYAVLGKYEIKEPCRDLMCIDKSWETDLQRFIERKRISGKSEKTLKQYKYQLEKALTYINKSVDKITEADLNGYLEAYKRVRAVSNSYLDDIRRTMTSFFGWLHKKGFISRDPAAGIDPIKVEKKIRKAYSDEELDILRRKAQNLRDQALIEVLYATGARISEICSLNREDVHITDREIIVNGKGAKERQVFLTPVAAMYLLEYLRQRIDDNPALFVSLKKPYNRLTTQGAGQMLRSLGRDLGIENVHAHRFRRTMATHLLKRGCPLEEVKTILGHEKVETTLLYALVDKTNVKSDYHKYMAA